MSPAVSVLISTHSPHEGRLKRTLQGLRAQTIPLGRWELVLVDNATPDPGRCQTFDLAWHPNAELWTSDSPSERELARALCHTCPIEQPCRDWSAHLPMSDDAIYGGLTRSERRTLRRAHLAQIAREALAGS